MVSGSHRVPSPSRNHPLKSIAQTAFGLVAWRSGSVRGCLWRVRLRGVTRPCRFNSSPTVLEAGRSHLRSCRPSHVTIFFGPQVGYSRRNSMSRSPSAAEIARLLLLGRRERSCSPARPATSNWCSHLYPVFGATPKAAQRLLNVALCLRSRLTNRNRSLVASIWAQGMAGDCYPCLRSKRYPCIRSGPGGVGVDGVAGASGTDPTATTVTRNIVRGVQPAGTAWAIADLAAEVKSDGRITADGRGLIFSAGNTIGTALALTP